MKIILFIFVFIAGVITGTVMMCVVQINRYNEYKRTLAKLKSNDTNLVKNQSDSQTKGHYK